jgi:hypothetical protein
VSKRILMFGLLALFAVSSTGCFPRIRQCIANRWQMHHGAAACGTPCCTPAFKVPAQAVHFGQPGCSTCGIDGGYPAGIPVVQGPTIVHPGAGTPTIGAPMPLLNGGTPNPMPGKN